MHSEYPDFIARFYDVLYDRIRSSIDHEYYLQKAKEAGGPVLEVGAGTGRLFVDALRAGVDICGVDISPSMLAQLRRKVPVEHQGRIIQADIRHLKLGRKFDLIIAPFRVMSHLESTTDQVTALRAVREHLADEGRFIFDVFVPDPVLCYQGLKPTVDFDGEWSPGRRLVRTVTVVPQPDRQVNLATMHLAWDEDGDTHEAEWTFAARYFFRYELEHLVARAGLTLASIFGNFNEEPLNEQSKDFIVVCTR